MNEINQINNEPVRKSRILLVDDEPGLRTAVKTFLEDEGFEIFIAVVSLVLATISMLPWSEGKYLEDMI